MLRPGSTQVPLERVEYGSDVGAKDAKPSDFWSLCAAVSEYQWMWLGAQSNQATEGSEGLPSQFDNRLIGFIWNCHHGQYVHLCSNVGTLLQ